MKISSFIDYYQKNRVSGVPLELSRADHAQHVAQYIELVKQILATSTESTLDLRDVSMGKIGIGPLISLLKTNTNLKCLDLSTTSLNKQKKVQELFEALKHNSHLEILKLDSVDDLAEGATTLGECLLENSTLTELSLKGTWLRISEKKFIIDALKINSTVRILHWGSNSCSKDSCTEHLAESLIINTTLTELNLTDHRARSSDLTTLFSALKINSTLITLNFNRESHSNNLCGYNGVGSKALRSLSEAIAVNSSLQNLHFDTGDREKYDEDACNLFFKTFETNCTLRSLSWDGTGFSEESLRLFGEIMETNVTLTNISIPRTVSAGSKEKVIMFVDRNRLKYETLVSKLLRVLGP